MGATYTRQSSFTDGDVITADLFNNEYDQLLAAFASSSGHTHDGTAGEGGPLANMLGHSITFGSGTAGSDVVITFDGETNDGVFKWMEDEDYFEFSDDVLIATTEKVQFRDTAIYIHSSADGQLDLVADTEIQIAATTIDINGLVDISGNLSVGGNLDVTGTIDFSDSNITNAGTMGLDSIFGDDDANTSITFSGSDVITIANAGTNQVTFNDGSIAPVTDSDVDLGTDSLRFKDAYIDSATVTGNVLAGGTVEPAGDTAAGDNAAIGYTSVEGLILTGQGSTNDVTIKNDADADVIEIPTGTVNVTMAGTLDVVGDVTGGNFQPDGDTAAGDAAAIGYTSAEGLILTGQGSTNDITIKNDADADVITIATGTTVVGIPGSLDIEGAIDVNGTANLDVVDIDGAVDMATTLQVDGVATFTGRDIHSGGITIANAGQIGSVGDTDAIAIASDGVVTLTQKLIGTELDISGDIDVDGTANLDIVDIDGAVDMATTLAVAGNVDFNGDLDVDGTTNLDIVDIDGAVNMATTALVTGVLTTTAATVFNGGFASNANSTVGGTLTATKLVSANGILELDDNGSHNGIINSPASLVLNIDSDNGATNEKFEVAKDRTSTSGGTVLFTVNEDGSAAFSGAVTANAGVVVDTMTLDAATLTATGNFTVDAVGDVILDADSDLIKVFASGTQFGTFYSTGSNFLMYSAVSDKDIIFQGNDGGSTITALTLDMSEAGAATFNNDVNVGASFDVTGNAVIDGTLAVGAALSSGYDASITGGLPLNIVVTSTASSSSYGGVGVTRNHTGTGQGTGIGFQMNSANGTQVEYAYLGTIIESNADSNAHDGSIGLFPVLNSARVQGFTVKSSGDCQINDGNLVVASGHGISFAATADGGVTTPSELLDDYEEGTWTPTIVTGNNNIDSNIKNTYTRIGNQVYIQLYFSTGTNTGNTETFIIGGLPFTIPNGCFNIGSVDIGKSAHVGIYPRTKITTTNLEFFYSSGDVSTDRQVVLGNDIGASSYIILSIAYLIN